MKDYWGKEMIRKGLAIAAILLLLGVAFTSSINANVGKSSIENVHYTETMEETIDVTAVESDLQRIMKLVHSINLRKIIINPETLIDTLEEISTLIENNEDCGCQEDSSDFKWFFPVICTLLFPIWAVVFLLTLFFGYPFGEFMMHIGISLNCFWAWN